MNQFYTLWHGGFAPVKIVSSWVENSRECSGAWNSASLPKRRVWQVQILDCNCGTCDRSDYTRTPKIYPAWAGGAAADNRICLVVSRLYKSPDFRNSVEEQ